MHRQRLNRPSLRITRHVEQDDSTRFTFEIWSPFVANYLLVESVEDGLRRVGELADLISQMWLQRHPRQNALTDVPDADATDHSQWAEFRINATAYRSYDTRRHNRPGWARATGMIQAAETTCARVGLALPSANAS